MAGSGAPEIFGQIQSLVSDKLQVVSYKWLSRNFSVSSNCAKRLLQQFVEKHSNELEVIYTLSGWLMNNAEIYAIRLASGLNLAEVKQEFKDNCSVQVYSVQACIPKDLAVLWSAEFVQAEELFNQPSTDENCFRDNRFCGVSNSFVKRNIDEKSASVVPPQPKKCSGIDLQTKTDSTSVGLNVKPFQQGQMGQSSAVTAVRPCNAITSDDKSDKVGPKVVNQTAKPHDVKESDSVVHAIKQKNQNEKASSGTSGSIATLWGRATSKSKPSDPIKDSNSVPSKTAEAQNCAQESVDAYNSDNDEQDLKKSNGAGIRKRRVIMDFSDDDSEAENVVSLSSPEPPNGHPIPDSLDNTGNSILEKKNLNSEEQKADTSKVHQINTKERSSGVSSECEIRAGSSHNNIPEGPTDTSRKSKPTDPASTSPKRRKVLKTRIDERGREVNDVVWEEEAAGSISADKNISTGGAGNRAPIINKSPAVSNNGPSNPVSKAGNKKAAKGGGKDPKQGNIMSFFKKA